MYSWMKLTFSMFTLSTFLTACPSPQDGEITGFYVDNQTDQNVVVEYELGGDGTQASDPIAVSTEALLFTVFGECLDVSLIDEARVYSSDSNRTLLRTITDSEWRKESQGNSCSWHLDLE